MRKFLTNKGQKRGIAVVFFAAVFGLLLGFMMMVANTGLLIYQKIQLQTAVDLAAYAGASVQASYLGNDQSGEDSIRAINQKIMSRYGRLLNELQFGSVVPPPVAIPDFAACVALCAAANLANGSHAKSIYQKASRDLDEYREKIAAILMGLPQATREAVEQTIALNLKELSLEDKGFGGETIREAEDVISAAKGQKTLNSNKKKKNAVLTFETSKGMYLTNVVGSVPHVFTYFGPACFDANMDIRGAPPAFYCAVNGQGAPGTQAGLGAAMLAYARAFAPAKVSGNIGNLSSIADSGSNAIRLHFIQNPRRPDPWVTVAAEWYPATGRMWNFENSMGAKGTIFPTQSRLVAVASAEPYGGNLADLGGEVQFGTRLQSVRKVLLDTRMNYVKDDYPNLFEYFGSLSPIDKNGNAIESPYQVIRRFLH